jgi:hypothetical protein
MRHQSEVQGLGLVWSEKFLFVDHQLSCTWDSMELTWRQKMLGPIEAFG